MLKQSAGYYKDNCKILENLKKPALEICDFRENDRYKLYKVNCAEKSLKIFHDLY